MITPTRYKTLSDYISDAQIAGEKAITKLNTMFSDLSLSEVPDTNQYKDRLKISINYTIGELQKKHNVYSGKLRTFVSYLQTHVINNYGDLNQFLSDNNIQVTIKFADISNESGYPIDANNIEDAEYILCDF